MLLSLPRDAAYESSSVEVIAVNICRLEGCNGTIELVRLLLKIFRPYEKDLRVNKGNFAIRFS